MLTKEPGKLQLEYKVKGEKTLSSVDFSLGRFSVSLVWSVIKIIWYF